MPAGFADRHVVGCVDLSIDVLLEVQNERYSQILHLIDYIAYGLHLWYQIQIVKETCRKPTSQHPGLGSSLTFQALGRPGHNYFKSLPTYR